MRGIRGATTVERDEALLLRDATKELLQEIIDRNNLSVSQIVSAIFTVTGDLHSEFPARAARDLGWGLVPMLCTTEMDVPGAIQRCVRVLLHVDVEAAFEVKHVYLRGAEVLRPDL